jgi:hypothetical protein
MYEERDFPALCALFLRAVKETASADYSPGKLPPGRRLMKPAGGKNSRRHAYWWQ